MSEPKHTETTNSVASAAGVVASRRKLLKLSAGAAPVLMAFASRSAFACHSTTPSAFGSVCNSRPELLQSSNGRNPNSWASNTSWPQPYYREDKKIGRTQIKASTFEDVFCKSGATNPFGKKTTLLEVLGYSSSGNKGVARACVAALLNARSGRTPSSIMTADDAINIWREFSTRGHFEPIAGIKWYSDSPNLPYIAGSDTGGKGGIIGYLNTTWT